MAANESWTQDRIDDEMLSEVDGDEEYDESEDCGRWNDGRLTRQCRLAGTEWCDWCCPHSDEAPHNRRIRRRAPLFGE